ncbi:amidase domain-containing protein [Nocardiopsis mwathae]|nr:amidase domain-containing protein [Nocardiopsis mwathae]
MDRRTFFVATGLGATAVTLLPAGTASATVGMSPEEEGLLLRQARDYLALRADQLTNAPSLFTRLSDGLQIDRESEARIHDDIEVIKATREDHRSVDGGNASTDISVSLVEVRIDGDRLVATVEENTKLYYQNPEPDEPECEEYWLRHDFTFLQGPSGWVMLESMPEFAGGALLPSTQAMIDTGAAPAEPEVVAEAEAPLPEVAPELENGVGPKGLSKANKKKVVNYAQKYVRKYNKSYRSYKADCTNFVSQAMRAGGWKYKGSGVGARRWNHVWYYGPAAKATSYTWAGAENWGTFARIKSKRTRKIKMSSLAPGDILQAAWKKGNPKDHSMIVVKTGKRSEKYLNYHTPSTKEKKLSRVKKESPGADWYPHRT